MANFPSVTDETFDQEVLQSGRPVLVDFSASWCGPCKALAPTLDALFEEMKDRVDFRYVDIDQSRATTMRFGVMGVPTMVLFNGGEEVARLSGNQPKSEITKLIGQAVAV